MNTLMKFVLYSSSLLLHVFSRTSQALERPTFHIVDTNAYLSTSNVCNSIFTTGFKNNRSSSTFKLVEKFSPCFSNKTGSIKPSFRDIISRDQSRVESIHKLGLDSARSYRRPILPPESFNASNYVVTMELGTPAQPVSFLFSISANYTSAQCAPLYISSGDDESNLFNSTASTTFSYITCDAPQCTDLFPDMDCSVSAYCNRHVADNFIVSFSKDNLTLMSTPTSNDVFTDFVFGCSNTIPGLEGSIAGFLGFSRDKYSFVSQKKSLYDQVFSYCLPQNATQLGYLRFGDDEAYNNTMLTDLVDCPIGYSTSYCINITGIAVGRVQLPINQSVFETSGAMMIDSDTTFTRLPPEAYTQLRTEFKQQMANYTPAPSYNKSFDTCYDTRNSPIIKVPTVSFTIGDVPVNMDPSGILFPIDNTTLSCLAFIGNIDPHNITIFGSTQQKGLKVMFDVGRRKIGFGQGDCFPLGG